MKPTLLFVYNANSDLFSSVTDFAHKILSPKTYSCSLCAMTYDNFGMKKEWEQFVKELNADVLFLHKNEFIKKHSAANAHFPAIFTKKKTEVKLFISDKEINSCNSLTDLKGLVVTKVNQL